MGLFDWLSGKECPFLKFDDAYAISRSALWILLKPAVNVAMDDGKIVWLIVHFTETFVQLQEQLDVWEFDYEVVSHPIEPGFADSNLKKNNLLDPSSIKLVLAELTPILPSESLAEVNKDHRLAMMVIERHPLISYDEHIVDFAKKIPFKVELGYFLSLDDVVVKHLVSETTIVLLKQLGLNEHQLVSSNMVTRRLDTTLKRLQADFTGDQAADSAYNWLKLNSRNFDSSG